MVRSFMRKSMSDDKDKDPQKRRSSERPSSEPREEKFPDRNEAVEQRRQKNDPQATPETGPGGE